MLLGLRRGEVLGLQWSDINWVRMTLTVKHNMTYDELSMTKNRKSRTIELDNEFMVLLKAQRDRQRHFKEKLWNKYNKSDFVVTYDNGNLIAPQDLIHMFRHILEKAELEVIRFHDLRHTAASLMLMNDVDMKTVSMILGHSTIGITVDTYGHISEKHIRSAVHTMSQYIIK
jgi:integrase